MEVSNWSAAPGTYVLVLDVPSQIELIVGALGRFVLPPGRYAYVGSALGPGGLRGRLGRHLRQSRRSHWHVDYLLATASLAQVIAAAGTERLECRWVRMLVQLSGAWVPIPGFGSSDCVEACPAHLVGLPADAELSFLQSGSQPVQRLPALCKTEGDMTDPDAPWPLVDAIESSASE